jgi:hypothetical protein
MPEALASLVKQRHCPTEDVRTMAGYQWEQLLQEGAKRLLKPRASEWLLDSVHGLWLAFIAGLRVEAGRCCLGLLKTARSESDGRG